MSASVCPGPMGRLERDRRRQDRLQSDRLAGDLYSPARGDAHVRSHRSGPAPRRHGPGSRRTRRSGRRQHHPPVPRQRSGRTTSSTCAGASRRRGGPTGRRSPTSPRASQLAKLQELVRYWGTDYDWRKVEAKLNALPQFVTEIDGLDIQFIHVRSTPPERPAADHDPRLAGLGPGTAEGHRPAHRPHRARRPRGGRLRPRAALDARLRLLGQAHGPGLGRRPHRAAPGTC